MRRTTSKNGCRFVSLEEGRAKWDSLRGLYFPYRDPVGKWTIGVGHLIGDGSAPGTYTVGITDAEVDQLLSIDLKKCDQAIDTIRWPEEPTQNQWDALASWLFNVGVGWALNRTSNGLSKSEVVRCIESRRYEAVPAALCLYDVADGKPTEYLRARRIREGRLFMLPDTGDQTEVRRLAMVAGELKYEAERARALSFGRLDLLSEKDLG